MNESNPYRILGESTEPPAPPPPSRLKLLLCEMIEYLPGLTIIGLFLVILLFCGNCIYQIEKRQDAWEASKRNTCEIVPNRTTSKFEVLHWNEKPESEIEGFFDKKADAEAFLKTLPECNK